MKTKLLKKLREKAKNRFCVKRFSDGYYIVKRTWDIDGFEYDETGDGPFKYVNDATVVCDMNRRAYMLSVVRHMAKESKERIVY